MKVEYQTIKAGDILVSSPFIENSLMFHNSVILIISHDKTGTSGVIVNKVISKVNSKVILKTLDLKDTKGQEFPLDISVYFGGPVDSERGVLLHSTDYVGEPMMQITAEIALSSDAKIIKDILGDKGPKHKILALGYAAWEPGQLMEEIKDNSWIILPNRLEDDSKSSNFKLIFECDNIYKWNNSLKNSGISLINYSNLSGNA
jgi:putative transcriptional regulator